MYKMSIRTLQIHFFASTFVIIKKKNVRNKIFSILLLYLRVQTGFKVRLKWYTRKKFQGKNYNLKNTRYTCVNLI